MRLFALNLVVKKVKFSKTSNCAFEATVDNYKKGQHVIVYSSQYMLIKLLKAINEHSEKPLLNDLIKHIETNLRVSIRVDLTKINSEGFPLPSGVEVILAKSKQGDNIGTATIVLKDNEYLLRNVTLPQVRVKKNVAETKDDNPPTQPVSKEREAKLESLLTLVREAYKLYARYKTNGFEDQEARDLAGINNPILFEIGRVLEEQDDLKK